MKKYNLMSYQEYSKGNYVIPYLYKLENRGQYLYYFGSRHTYDSNDEQIVVLEKFLEDFCDDTKDSDRLALLEGGRRKASTDKENSIKEGGEIQYASFLLNKKNIVTSSPEPTSEYWFNTLSKKFSRDEVAYYDFARVCYQWNKKGSTPAFDKYISNFLDDNSKNSGWSDYDFSLEHLKKIHQSIFNTKFNELDEDFFYNILNPTTSFSIINKISRFDDEGVRDSYIFSEIKNYWKKGKSLFIVFGQQHAVIMEEELQKLVLSKNKSVS